MRIDFDYQAQESVILLLLVQVAEEKFIKSRTAKPLGPLMLITVNHKK